MVAPNCLFVAVDRSVADHDDQDPLLLFDPSVRPSMQLLANRAFVDHIASGILRADDGGSCQEVRRTAESEQRGLGVRRLPRGRPAPLLPPSPADTISGLQSTFPGRWYRSLQERNSGGVAIGDADGDGRPDLLFSRLHGGPVLYRNLGNGSFEDVTLASGLVFVDEPHDLSGRPPACTVRDSDASVTRTIGSIVPIVSTFVPFHSSFLSFLSSPAPGGFGHETVAGEQPAGGRVGADGRRVLCGRGQ